MDMFGKATRAVKEVGENVFDSAKSIGNSIYSTSKEQSELAGMKVQKSVIEKRLEESYAKIGKRYFYCKQRRKAGAQLTCFSCFTTSLLFHMLQLRTRFSEPN